jgi:hypothetical protein
LIEPPSCRQSKPGVFQAIRPLNWDEIINEDDDDDNWADSGPLSGEWNHPGDGNDNDDGESEEDIQGGEKGTRKGKGTKDGNGNRKATEDGKEKEKGKGKGNGKGKGVVKHTQGGDDIPRAVAVQLQKEMPEPDLDTVGYLEWVYL